MARALTFDAKDPQLFQLLRRVQPLKKLTDKEIFKLQSILKKVEYEAGETLFSEGDFGTCAYVVADGELSLERWGHTIKRFGAGALFGEIALVDDRPRTGTVRAAKKTVLYCMEGRDLEDDERLAPGIGRKIYQGFSRQLASYMREGADLFCEMDVLIIQDGGCAPGYNPVTAFVTEYLENMGRRVFIAAEGFKSVVANRTEDYRCLIHDLERFSHMDHISGVESSRPLRDRRGADFRSERFPEFKEAANQERAVKAILERKVKVLVGIGGNGTLAGIKALADRLPPEVLIYFVPVTIDSDVYGTHSIGEFTGVEVGAEKIRCYMADARTHKRCYIIEMMGADGGYHALHSCLGAGADLAVLPNSNLDLKKIAAALARRTEAVIVVAEGYKAKERKAAGYKGNAAEFFRDELVAAGPQAPMRLICEPFSRDVRGASPNNMDIMLSLRMARKIGEMVENKESRRMPAVLAEREYSIPLSEIRTDNSVESSLATLGSRLV
ncbi:MAG: 6-phosphofructokinase [Deltaproteobacteria bacterium]|nr:6-phosphofructokinase [Deltaproteobacteria bacterium]